MVALTLSWARNICGVITSKSVDASDRMGTKRILLYLPSVAWPSAEIAVMGAAGAADVVFRNHPDKKLMEQEYKDKFSTPLMAASRGYLDDIIQPRYSSPTEGENMTLIFSIVLLHWHLDLPGRDWSNNLPCWRQSPSRIPGKSMVVFPYDDI